MLKTFIIKRAGRALCDNTPIKINILTIDKNRGKLSDSCVWGQQFDPDEQYIY